MRHATIGASIASARRNAAAPLLLLGLAIWACEALALPAAIRLPPTAKEGAYALGAPLSSDDLGTSIADVGDINGDGRPDFSVSAVPATGTGEATDHVYAVFDAQSVTANGLIDFTKLNGTNGFRLDAPVQDFFGGAISHCDFDGDGIDDLVVGASGTLVGSTADGAVFVIYGTTKGFPAVIDITALDPKLGFRIDGDSSIIGYEQAGASLGCRANPSGSGPQDILIGAPGTRTFPNGYGSVYVVYGRNRPLGNLSLASLAVGSIVRLDGVAGGLAYEHTGTVLAGVGDVNGDGKDDFVFNCDPTADAVACVIFGGAPLPETMEVSSLAPPTGTFIGAGTSGVSDVTALSGGRIHGGPTGDILLGVYPSGPSPVAVAYVVFGRGSGIFAPIELSDLDFATGWKIVDGDWGSWVTSMSAMRDLDGDGVADLLVGTNTGGSQLGRWAYLLSPRGRSDFSSDIYNLNSPAEMVLCEESLSGGLLNATQIGDVLGSGMPAMLLSIGNAGPTPGGIYVVNGSDDIFRGDFDSDRQTVQQICQY